MSQQYHFLDEFLTPLTNDSLRIICKKLNLSRTGKKIELIKRIVISNHKGILNYLDDHDIVEYLKKNGYPYHPDGDAVIQLKDFWQQKEELIYKAAQTRIKANNESVKLEKKKTSNNDVKKISNPKITIQLSEEESEEEDGYNETSNVNETKPVLSQSNSNLKNSSGKIITINDKNNNINKNDNNNNNNNDNNNNNNDNILSTKNTNSSISSINQQTTYTSFTPPPSSSSSTTTNYAFNTTIRPPEHQIAEDFVKIFYALVNGPNPAITIVEQGLFFKDGTLNLFLHDNSPSKYLGIDKIALVFQDFRAANGQFNLCNIEAAVNNYGYISVVAYGNVTLPAKGVGPFEQKFLLCNYQGKWYVQVSELKIFDATGAIGAAAGGNSNINSGKSLSGSGSKYQITEM